MKETIVKCLLKLIGAFKIQVEGQEVVTVY